MALEVGGEFFLCVRLGPCLGKEIGVQCVDINTKGWLVLPRKTARRKDQWGDPTFKGVFKAAQSGTKRH